jgi:hypothetical protein
MRTDLLLSVCMHPDCKWVHPTYRKDVMVMMEHAHTAPWSGAKPKDWSGHDKFKRIMFNDAGVPEVWE